MIDIFNGALSALGLVAPIVIGGFGVLIAWGMLKWGKRFLEALHGLFEKPERVIFMLVVIGIMLWIWFSYGAPLLPKG